jgi:hypothetical protein
MDESVKIFFNTHRNVVQKVKLYLTAVRGEKYTQDECISRKGITLGNWWFIALQNRHRSMYKFYSPAQFITSDMESFNNKKNLTIWSLDDEYLQQDINTVVTYSKEIPVVYIKNSRNGLPKFIVITTGMLLLIKYLLF